MALSELTTLQRLPGNIQGIFVEALSLLVGWGTGTPEGNVTAGPGSLYLRMDPLPSLYTKSSGTGNTGWRQVRASIAGETLATIDFPSTASGAISESTGITVTGAQIGDTVTVAAPVANTAGTFFTGYVSAADTVKVQFVNLSGGAVDPASGSYKIIVTPTL